MKKNKKKIRQAGGGMAPFFRREDKPTRNQIVNQSKPMKKEFNTLVAKLEKELQLVIAQGIKESRAFAQEAMTKAFESREAKEYFPHDDMTAEETKAEALQWAEDALRKAMDCLERSYVKAEIMEESTRA
jgi:hypothetical protein